MDVQGKLQEHEKRLDIHDKRLDKGDKRMMELEKGDIQMGSRIDLLCQSIDTLTTQFERFFAMVTKIGWAIGSFLFCTFIGCIIWYIQTLSK